MGKKIPFLLTIVSVLAVVPLSVVAAASQVVALAAGDTVTIRCATPLIGTVGANRADLTCAMAVTATSTPPPATGATAGQPCPQALHDAFVTTGPDGKTYPTWHPPVHTSGCFLGHEHGSDPRTSNANAAMPAFGYVGAVAGVAEPHAGFKVFVWHNGEVTDDLTHVPADIRAVFHMGTAGVKRYTERFHSLEYDYVARDGTGREAHVAGMADTNIQLGSTCTKPRAGGRDFSTVGCNDPYEIWNDVHLQIKHPSDEFTDYLHTRLTISGSFAVFDPILTRDPADNSRVLYTLNYLQPGSTIDPTSASSPYRGCDREAYGGPNLWGNAGKPTVYYSDAYGNVNAQATGPGPGLIRQSVAAVTATSNESFKVHRSTCAPGVRAPN